LRDTVGVYLEDPERIPLLAYGANASPRRLALKLAHLPEGHREALILAGRLDDYDVAAAAQLPVFSSMAATIVLSPGTSARVAVMFLTGVQFTALWWTELSYRVGALEEITLRTPLTADPLRRVIAFVSRYGAFSIDGEPVAMAAIPADGRRYRALTQVELLAAAAKLTLGAEAGPRGLIRAAYEQPAAFFAEHMPAMRAVSRPFASPHWREMPA
jgi:hypothetical protein